MSRKLRNIKPYKVNRGVFEDQKKREDNKFENQRALLIILPLVMLAILAVGVFFGYKFYVNSLSEKEPISPSEAVDSGVITNNPTFYQAVNTGSPLKEDFAPEVVECCGIEVSPEVADSLTALVNAAKDKGYDLIVKDGYISYEEQNERYNEAVEKYRKKNDCSLVMAEAHVKKELPPAGESEQQTGLVVWLSVKTDGKFADTAAYSWLLRYGADYGFILRYPDKENAGGISYNSHLFRYVGKENAYQMRVLDMNFDEYINYRAAH